jgi:hypothetical protein
MKETLNEKQLVPIFRKQIKDGQWMVYSNFSFYHSINRDRKIALEYFVKELHLRNYVLLETKETQT